MATLKDAINLLEAGDWQAAHAIVERNSSSRGNWAHGIVHMMEGDIRNAGYWYRRVGRELPADDSIDTEIAALKAAAQGD